MEYIDVFDENNNPTGEIKEKQQAHEDGNFHRTAHVWIINDKNELLLQKRSASKKSHPNCWDISGAGHIRAGESVINGAIRELREELGVEAEEKDFEYIATIKSTKNPKNMEFGYVYLLRCNKKIEEYVFEDEEVSEVKYVYFETLEQMANEKAEGLLIHKEEFEKLFSYIRNYNKIKDLQEFYIYANNGLYIDTITEKDGYTMAYSKYVADYDSNYVTDINICNRNIESIEKEAEIELNKLKRKLCYIITPLSNIYDNRNQIFNIDKYDEVNNEVWQIYKDFEKLNEIEFTDNIILEETNDMEKFAEITYKAFNTGDSDDPYGDFDKGYIDLYKNYNKEQEQKYKKDFYFIKANDEIVGCTVGVYDKNIYGIYGLAIIKEYRGKGIGTEAIKQQLKKCNQLNRKMAFLQTEDGYYPANLYRKIGFKDVCNVYYYVKK